MGFNSRIFTITNAGFALFAKVQGGGTMQFTRYALGDGEIGSASASTLKTLISERASAAMESRTVSGARCTLTSKLLITTVAMPFYWRELGIYATDGTSEVLYAYASTGTPEYIDPAGGTTDKILSAQLEVGNAQITIAAPPSAMLVSRDELDAAEQLLNEKMSALESTFHGEMVTLSSALTQDMHNLEVDLTGQMDQVKAETGAEMDELSGAVMQQLASQDQRVNDALADMDQAKADKSLTRTLTLLATNWVDNQQTVAVPGVVAGAGQAGLPAPMPDSKEAWNDAGITMLDSAVDGQVTFTCESVPVVDITVRLILMEVVAG